MASADHLYLESAATAWLRDPDEQADFDFDFDFARPGGAAIGWPLQTPAPNEPSRKRDQPQAREQTDEDQPHRRTAPAAQEVAQAGVAGGADAVFGASPLTVAQFQGGDRCVGGVG
ncbi:hypothetical protein [Streptomyces sp. Ncost-T10-10d]|uniref:hypothetical protein n=1 Tax=Streptomyces sp. Ncost-T10-10d TaxID=1839774 RepID=UPI00210DB12A|nr:hypothetical protein [Streptomyces sp. Ncost-T10-10d]